MNLETRPQFRFDYNGQSRRVRKRVWRDAALESDVRYVYDGWNMIAELDASDLSPIRTYVWGLDLSGSLQGAGLAQHRAEGSGAGGVGGLLAILDGGDVYAPAYDGNGNITALVATEDASVVAVYEYDPFGNLLRQTGPYASSNPYRFSTKYTDETGLLYYGYRYYSPEIGRFINRDPIGQDGGENLYGFLFNNPVNQVDVLGQLVWEKQESQGCNNGPYDPIGYWHVPAETDVPTPSWSTGSTAQFNHICGESVIGRPFNAILCNTRTMGHIRVTNDECCENWWIACSWYYDAEAKATQWVRIGATVGFLGASETAGVRESGSPMNASGAGLQTAFLHRDRKEGVVEIPHGATVTVAYLEPFVHVRGYPNKISESGFVTCTATCRD